MGSIFRTKQPGPGIVTFYHDIEYEFHRKAIPDECRQIVREFLDLEKKYGVHVTYNVVGKLFRKQPDLIEWIIHDGHEVAFHSYNHQSNPKNFPHVLNPKYFSSEIDLCRDVSPLPCGYRSPMSSINQAAIQRLWEKGFLWNAEGGPPHEEPYFIHEGLVRLPITTDDWPLFLGKVTVDEYVQQFSEFLQRRPYVALGFHDSVTTFAPDERLKAWERLLQIAIESKALVVTFSEAADLYRRAAISKYYSQTAKAWNRDTKTPCRTKRFQEMVRAEAEKLNKPVIADLGSRGGVLSSDLRDIAKKIYCVDNAAGMLAGIDSGGCIEACLGEVTDSKLPENSVDFVICARNIEYLFWPNRLADEIKRIGKIGATYFVTFPALAGSPPSNVGSPPDRVRRHFTSDEIQKWAKQIGPGRLIGVQHETPEPYDLETEQHYPTVEKKPPPDPIPTDWVYIGTVQREFTPRTYRQTIPTSRATFRFLVDDMSGLKCI